MECWGLSFGFWVLGLGFWNHGAGCRVQCWNLLKWIRSKHDFWFGSRVNEEDIGGGPCITARVEGRGGREDKSATHRDKSREWNVSKQKWNLC